ncbi:hypothetical protein [Winogradskyella sp. R77965]|uniref:hypothetical protein n=1 Tax=Winogradskyella sp. R77965 TaxID=3093872 RepID=UPI0037DCA785
MKQFILAALLCISTFGMAQTITNQRTVTVYGSALKPTNEVLYKTEVTLTMDNGYYDDSPYKTLDDLMAKYYEELKKENVDISKFTRDDLAYVASGYRKKGTTLRFITKDKKEILRVTGIKMAQVMPSYVQVKSETTDEDVKMLTKKALVDARKNAEILTESAGEELDKIYSINSSYSSGYDSYWKSPNSSSEYFSITVVYTLKD